MTTKATAIEILDDARKTGEYDRLMRLLYVFLRGDIPEKDEIVQEALIEILRKFSAGDTSLSLAPQLRGFSNTCARRLQSQQKRAADRLGDTGDEVYDVVARETSDPAAVLVRLEDLDEKSLSCSSCANRTAATSRPSSLTLKKSPSPSTSTQNWRRISHRRTRASCASAPD